MPNHNGPCDSIEKLFLVSAMVAAIGCTSGPLTGTSSGTAFVQGTIAGRSLAAVQAVSWPGIGITVIDISNFDGACKAVSTQHAVPGSQLLGLDIRNGDSPKLTNNVVEGNYTVDAKARLSAGGIYFAEDSTCMGFGSRVQSGSVQITGVAGDAIVGTFDVVLSATGVGGDHIIGDFNATPCPPFVSPAPSAPICP